MKTPASMDTISTLGIIGGGPSALFSLSHIHDDVELLRERFDHIIIFEREESAGPGMPYSRVHTSDLNLSNISSEELPKLPETFADWLRSQSEVQLRKMGIKLPISESEIYPRVVLGDYFKAQFEKLSQALEKAGVTVTCHTGSEVCDIIPLGEGGYDVVTRDGGKVTCGTVVIATGHVWKPDEDAVNLASPWPIHKLLPAEGQFHNFAIGLLGASLSAVDVVNVLAHRHGSFSEKDGTLVYHPAAGADGFKLVMHSADGLLSHLQFEQEEPKREVYRHCSEEDIQKLLDENGLLKLSDYFDKICRPVLVEALRLDGMDQEAEHLDQPSTSFRDFSEMMKEKHLSDDPFGQMKTEFEEERKKVKRHRPTHWKEVLDDLMYTLNFHARLLPAEDHQELKSRILPFVMNVMAALPLKSASILTAVHDAGRLELISGMAEIDHKKDSSTVTVKVGDGADEKPHEYQMFIDCSGQSPVNEKSFPFKSLITEDLLAPAVADLRSKENARKMDSDIIRKTPDGRTVMKLGGMAVTDGYQMLDREGNPVEGLYNIAVPHIAGLRPYCYGLQACDEAAEALIAALKDTGSSDTLK